jgi:hypothetical protein
MELLSKVYVPHSWKPWHIGNITFKRYLNDQRKTMCKTLLPLTQMYCSIRYMSFSISLKRVFFTKWMTLPIKYAFKSQLCLSQANSILKENNVLDCPSSNIDGFLPGIQWFFNSCEGSSLHKVDVLTLETLRGRQYSFQKVTEVSFGTICKILLPLTQIVFFHKIHVFLHFFWRVYFS